MGNELLTRLGMRIKGNLLEEQAARFDDKYFLRMPYRDTSDVWRQFAIWLLVDEEHGVLRFTKPGSLQYKAIQRVAHLYIKDCNDIKLWQSASAAATYAGCDGDATYAASFAAYAVAACAATTVATTASSAAATYAACAATAADTAADTAAIKEGFFVHYGRMANKLIELLKNAPMIHDTQSTHCKRIANKLSDLINKQESMVNNMDNAVESVMDNAGKIIFSISHHNGTKHIMRGKEAIEKHVRQIEYALSVVKALLKDNPSDAISINVGIFDGTISITYPSK